MAQGTKHRKDGKSSVMRKGEALARADRTGIQIIGGRAVASASSGGLKLLIGGETVDIGGRLAKSVERAALDPKNSRGSLYVSVSAPPPARLVKLSPAELQKIRAAVRARNRGKT